MLVPSFPTSLLSVNKLCSTGSCQVIFTPTCCIFQDTKTMKEIGRGLSDGNLYYLRSTTHISSAASHGTSMSTALKWHFRLGYPNLNKLKLVVPFLSNVSPLRCQSCQLSKHSRASLPLSSKSRSNNMFDVVHFDIWGHMFLIIIISNIIYS